MRSLLPIRFAVLALVIGSVHLVGCEASRSSTPAEPSSNVTAPLDSAAPSTSSAPTPTNAPSSAPTDAAAVNEPQATAIGKKDILVVSFISPGDGTDHAAYDRLRATLKTLPKVPPFVSHLWGKEGEHDECFDLSALSAPDRKAFLARVSEAVRSSKKVTITENGTCHEGR